MPEYVYACKVKDHPKVTKVHRMLDNPVIRCPVCRKKMHRVPQKFRFYLNPLEIFRAWSEENWSRKLRGEPREEYNVSSKVGIPQKNFDTRKRSATK
jgi:elongation factor P--beta-lysine ligase